MRGLYAIADVTTLAARNVDVVAFARAVLLARPAALQVRAKDLPARELLVLLRTILPMSRQAGVPLVTNDRVDVAALVGTEFVHVGQSDMPLESVHRLAPRLGVGVSTHTLEQLEAALAHAPGYVAFGPVYSTRSKTNPEAVVGVALLRAAHARARAAGVPLVAIGGITHERASEVAACAEAGAVIAALLPAEGAVNLEDVTARARRLHAALAAPMHESPSVVGAE